MSEEIVKIGVGFDTSGLKKGGTALKNFTATGKATEKSITSGFGAMAAAIGTVVAAVKSLDNIVSVTRKFDILNSQLITATGSAKDAAKAFDDLTDFAARTPYDIGQVTDSFVKLVNLGLTPSEAALKSYGNTASAMGKTLNQLIEAVADAATGEFERLKEFGIKAKSQGDDVSFTFRGMTTTVKKEAAEIEGYLKSLGENEFAGSMANRMDTLDGKMSLLGDAWEMLFLNVSNSGVGGVIESQVDDGISALDSLNGMVKSGELEANIELIGKRLQWVGESAIEAFDSASLAVSDSANFMVYAITSAFSDADKVINGKSVEWVGILSDALFQFPENVKAAMQLVGVEVASIAIYAEAYGGAFLDIMSIKFKQMIEVSKLVGAQMAAALNPFSDDDIDYDKEIAVLASSYGSAVDEILTKSISLADANTQIRRSAITDILAQRDASLSAVSAELDGVNSIGIAYDKMLKERADRKSSLAGFEISGSGDDGQSAAIKSAMDDLEDIEDSIDGIGGAWSNTGSVIIDTFGSMTDVVSDYINQIDSLDKIQEKINKARLSESADQIALDEMQMKVNNERLAAELSGIGQVVDGVKDELSEKTAAYKALDAISQGIHAAEMVMSVAKIAASMAETTAVVANETTKQTAYGLTAVLNQGDGDPYSAWARMAAMAAVVVGLGVAISGSMGGGGQSAADIQESQGTGTILGDSEAKSDSIAGSLEAMEDIGINQLSELIELNATMAGLGEGLTAIGVATDELGGDASELTVVNMRTASLRDENGTQSYSEELRDSVQSVLVGAREAIGESAEFLGVGIADDIAAYIVPAFTVNLEDLSADEQAAEIAAVFSSVIDEMASDLLPALEEFKDVGEGLFETVVRLAVEQASFNDHLDAMGTSLSDLSNVMQIDVAQSIIDAIGGFEEFTEAADSLIDEFFTDSEQLAILKSSLTDVFDELGIGLVDSKDEFRALLSEIDITTESGQALYASLLAINPELADYINALDDLASDKLSLQIQLLEAQGDSETALALARQQELDSMDESLVALQKQVWAEEDLADARADAESELSSLISSIRGSVIDLDSSSLDLSGALADAISGDFDAANELDISSLATLNTSEFSNVREMNRQQAINNDALNQIADLAEGQLSDVEEQTVLLASIDDGISVISANFIPMDNSGNIQSMDYTSLLSEFKEMKETMMAQGTSIVNNTRETANNTLKIAQDEINVVVV